jgi:hypothetical protein
VILEKFPESAIGTVALQPASANSLELPAYTYGMFGMHVLSQVKLPIPQTLELTGTNPDWLINWIQAAGPPPAPRGQLTAELRCSAPCHAGQVALRIYRGPTGTWFESDRGGTFHVHPSGHRVDVYTSVTTDPQATVLMLIGQIASFVLHQLGHVVLHASAVITHRGALAFLGAKGQGKSTMAACFLQRGAELLTDDALPIRLATDGVFGTPGMALLKVWPETAQHTLELTRDLPNAMNGTDKKLLVLDGRYAFAAAPALLRGMYVLERYDPATAGTTECSIRDLSAREAVIAMLTQISWAESLNQVEHARLLPRYARMAAQVPFRAIRYPSGFDQQQRVYISIMDDLGRA